MRHVLPAFLALCLVSSARAESPMFAEQPGPRGILYSVHRGASPTLYLFGTIHVSTATQTPFSHAVKTALAPCKRLALEADPSDIAQAMGSMMRLGRYPEGDSLRRHVPPAVMKEIEALLTKEHVPVAQVERLKLWAVPAVLSMAPTVRAGLDASYGADTFLAAWAHEHAVPILEIEGWQFQLELLSAGTDKDQLALLEDELVELKKKDLAVELKKLVDEWAAGDEKALQRELLDDSSKSEVGRRFEEKLLDQRNVGMANKAESYLALPGDTFFAVGSAHLLGAKGLVALMKQRGYEVRPVR